MTYQICTKTVMDTSDPSITFDKDGISNHYHDFHNVVKPNWHPDERGRQELERMVGEIKKADRGKEFDCLLGLSGGMDSSYMLHTMVTQFGLRPLVFHVDGGWNSELAVHNIHVLIDKLGLDLYTEVINWEEMRDFQLAWFKSGVPHIDIPQDHAFIAVLDKFAEKYDIKYILNGGNIATECVSIPYKYFYWGNDTTHNRDIVSKFCSIRLTSYPFTSNLRHKFFLPYVKGVKTLKPLNLMPYSKKHAISTLEKLYGWKAYPQKHFESRFTRFFEGYWLPVRFGFDVRRCQLSSLILTDQITRDEALRMLQEPSYDANAIMHDFEYIATKLGISTKQLNTFFELPRKYYFDYKNASSILKLGATIYEFLGLGRRGGSF